MKPPGRMLVDNEENRPRVRLSFRRAARAVRVKSRFLWYSRSELLAVRRGMTRKRYPALRALALVGVARPFACSLIRLLGLLGRCCLLRRRALGLPLRAARPFHAAAQGVHEVVPSPPLGTSTPIT